MKPGCYHFNQMSKSSFMRDCPSTRRIVSRHRLQIRFPFFRHPTRNGLSSCGGVEQRGGGRAALICSGSGQDISNRLWQQTKTRIEESNLCFVNGCDLDSARLKMRADRAAGTEKSAVPVSTCAGTCRPRSRFSHASIVGHCRAPKNGGSGSGGKSG